MKQGLKPDVFMIRCLINGKRKLTHTLSKREAINFRQAALHLAEYLAKEYKIQ